MAFKVNGVTIRNPSSFKIEMFNITTMERLANGDMSGDFIAQKKKFYFTFDALPGIELDQILSAIWTAKLFFQLEYEYNGTTKTATVYVGSIPAELYRAGKNQSNWVWQNVTFNLIER